MNGTDEELPQEYEQIPWSHLVPVQKDRSIQLALLVVVIAASLIAILLFVRRTPPAVIAAEPPVTEVEDPIVVSTPAPAVSPVVVESADSVLPTIPSQTPVEPQIYSEADLMAAIPIRPELEAIARAEWFVTDFFTVDGDGALGDSISAAMPDAVTLPESDGSAISYVEWARAIAVADALDGSFRVTVWFRTLVGTGDSGFDRSAVRAVEVRLVTDAAGRLAIADLPVAGSVKAGGIAPPWPGESAPPPDVVAAGATDAALVGSDPELTSAGRDDEGWRLVFSVGDASGLRFPIVVRAASG